MTSGRRSAGSWLCRRWLKWLLPSARRRLLRRRGRRSNSPRRNRSKQIVSATSTPIVRCVEDILENVESHQTGEAPPKPMPIKIARDLPLYCLPRLELLFKLEERRVDKGLPRRFIIKNQDVLDKIRDIYEVKKKELKEMIVERKAKEKERQELYEMQPDDPNWWLDRRRNLDSQIFDAGNNINRARHKIAYFN